ncbi:MAG: hypothetical protein IKY61_02925, partial [Thermoguttaceae bacterium]|nr:hypothetical protein [Thermoguttaceae bacterium]
YDYQGNFRGRESEGVATCSPGAFETIQADLFWVGRDATGAEVVSPSFLTSNGWAASRFATVSGDVAPQSGNAVLFDGSIVLDGNGLRLSKFIVGGGASLGFDNSSGATLTGIADQFDVGAGATLRTVGASTQRFQIGRAALVSRFGEWINVQPQFLLGDAAALDIAPTAKFATVASSVKLYANGFYTNYNLQIANVATVEGDSSGCENIYVSFQKPTARIAANGTPRVACKLVKWTPPTDATSDFTALEAGSAPIVFAPSRSATVAGNGSRDDFLIDVSNAQPSGTLALTLTGQALYGDAPSSAVSLTGVARIDERGLTSQTLTLNADATLNVDGAIVSVETATLGDASSTVVSGGRVDAESLTVADGASLTLVGGNICAASLSVANGASVEFSPGAGVSPFAFENATIQTEKLTTLNDSRFVGCGQIVFSATGNWLNEGATLNGVAAENYDAASNDLKIVYHFDASEIRNAFNDGVCRWTSEALDAGTLPFVFGKYSLDAQGKGDYRTIYDSTQPIVDASAPVYETNVDWNGDALKTVVHAAPEAGWNFYRVEVSPFANLGGAKIYHGGKTTRYFVFWNADYEPEPTYYYVGGAKGSFQTTSDWALTADGVAKFEGAPTSQNATYVIPRSATLRDCPSDHVQISVVFPSVVDVYNANGRQLSTAEARLVSVGVPTPSAPEFYVGTGGTSGFWTQCDGATLYRVEAS